MHAKFQNKTYREYDVTEGWIFPFSIDFCIGLTSVC